MFEAKRIEVPVTLKEDAPGGVLACFSTFGVVDRGNDIVIASAFTHGQEVPMTAFGHDWSQPVGKGRILVEQDRALFDGAFFMSTQAGRETYETVKALGAQAEWSWGFKVEDASFEQRGEQLVRVIKRAEIFEVSPVLIGEGLNTYTLGIKSSGQSFADHAEAVLAAVKEFVTRSRSLADLRAKEGRQMSSANMERMRAMRDAMAAVMADMDAMMADTAPPEKALALFAEYQRTLARLQGVAIN